MSTTRWCAGLVGCYWQSPSADSLVCGCSWWCTSVHLTCCCCWRCHRRSMAAMTNRCTTGHCQRSDSLRGVWNMAFKFKKIKVQSNSPNAASRPSRWQNPTAKKTHLELKNSASVRDSSKPEPRCIHSCRPGRLLRTGHPASRICAACAPICKNRQKCFVKNGKPFKGRVGGESVTIEGLWLINRLFTLHFVIIKIGARLRIAAIDCVTLSA